MVAFTELVNARPMGLLRFHFRRRGSESVASCIVRTATDIRVEDAYVCGTTPNDRQNCFAMARICLAIKASSVVVTPTNKASVVTMSYASRVIR